MLQETQSIHSLLSRYETFHPVVPFDVNNDKLTLFDFTGNNKEWTEEILNDTNLFSEYITGKLNRAQAKYGIGGYNEHRTVYSRSKHFDPANEGDEPRRLHLGVDIWGPVNTPVMAPLNGIVHSFAFNNNFGDYGATIILTHNLEGYTFHTLYGHLSLNSIKNMQEGNLVKRGDVFAEFGMQFENGHWPPHLHFQLITHMGDYSGDYPGVCKYSERERYLYNSPDPDLLLRINKWIRE